MATLINGNGNASVYAQQDADLYAGFKGNSTQILNVGSKLAATIEDSNTIAVADGVILTKEGRRIQVDVGNIDEFIIPTGQAGTTRYYIFGYHLYTDGSANQKCETFVQLMSDGSETITENTFRGGATEVYVSLYRVKQEGLTLGTPAALLSVCETIDEIKSDIDGITASLTAQQGEIDDMQYRVIHTASGSATWTNKLAEIMPYVHALSDEEKSRCCLTYNGDLFRAQSIQNNHATFSICSANIISAGIQCMMQNGNSYSYVMFGFLKASGAFSVVDYSANTTSEDLSLVVV